MYRVRHKVMYSTTLLARLISPASVSEYYLYAVKMEADNNLNLVLVHKSIFFLGHSVNIKVTSVLFLSIKSKSNLFCGPPCICLITQVATRQRSQWRHRRRRFLHYFGHIDIRTPAHMLCTYSAVNKDKMH